MKINFDPNGAVIGNSGALTVIVCATDINVELYQGATITAGSQAVDVFDGRLEREPLIEKLTGLGAERADVESALDQLKAKYN